MKNLPKQLLYSMLSTLPLTTFSKRNYSGISILIFGTEDSEYHLEVGPLPLTATNKKEVQFSSIWSFQAVYFAQKRPLSCTNPVEC
jgi:hypothetical protein